MDQLKALGRVFLKHGFWIMCGAIVLVSVGSWYSASDSLKKDFTANRTTIESSFSSANSLKVKPNPPNDHSRQAMEKLNAETLQLVVQAWEQQYSFQTRILRWNPRLGDDFVAAVRPLKPIELKIDFPTPERQKLKVDYRQRYANYVANLLPYLADLVQAEWHLNVGLRELAEGENQTLPTEPRRLPPGIAPPDREPPVVDWSSGSQSALWSAHFNWRDQPDAAPTTLQVLYAQEDLWVLDALMRIIRKTNEGAESRHDAVVKSIQTIMLGRNAGARAGQVMRLGASTTGGYGDYGAEDYGNEEDYGEESYGEEGYGEESYGEESYGEEGYGEEGAGGSYGETGGYGAAPVSLDPADGRYVNNEYVRLRATELRTALRQGGPENAFLVVAKRMPIRLELVVDGRKLHRLLAECGNSALPVEVRQVRINRSGGGSGAGGYGGYGGEMGGYGGEMGGYGGEMGGFGGFGAMGGFGEESYGEESYGEESYGGYGEEGYGEEAYGGDYGAEGTQRAAPSSNSPYDVKVEIYGVIYIYNPVDKEKLGGSSVTFEAGPPAAGEATPAADGSSPPPATAATQTGESPTG